MDTLSVYADAGRTPAAISKPRPGPLLELLLSDAATDVEVVTRELDLRDEMRERLRRALHRVACARAVLQAVGEGWVARTLERGDSDVLENVGRSGEGAMERVRSAVEILAEDCHKTTRKVQSNGGSLECQRVGRAPRKSFSFLSVTQPNKTVARTKHRRLIGRFDEVKSSA
jgi:hypothetical protein